MGGLTIPDQKKGGHYSIYTVDDFEYVNPIDKMEQIVKESHYRMRRDFIALQFPITEIVNRILIRETNEDWRQWRRKIDRTRIPAVLMRLLEATRKKDQVKLLQGLVISSDQLVALCFYAWNEYRFTHSQYSCEHYPNLKDKSKLPLVVEVRKNDVDVIGPTELSKGQLRQTIDQRHSVVAKFLDKGDVWHCFFLTYKSVDGKEVWKEGTPHYHYISNSFGIPRAEVVQRLQSTDYSLGSLPHIELLRPKHKYEGPRD